MHSLLEGGEDVRITWVLDAHHTHSVESTRSSSELNVVSFEVEHSGSTEDGHIFELGLSDGWTVVGESIFTISVMIHIRDIKQQHILTPMYQSILRMITLSMCLKKKTLRQITLAALDNVLHTNPRNKSVAL